MHQGVAHSIRRRRAALAAAACAVAAALWMGWPGPDALAGPDAAALPGARAVEAAAGAGSLRHGEPASPARQAFAEAIPPGVTGAQWHQLQAELRGRPDGAAELRRLADYFAWSDGLHRLREARR